MTMIFLQSPLKSYSQLRAPTAMVRLRLFEVVSVLPPVCLETAYAALLRLLVAEFTLADSTNLTSTSLLTTVCHQDDTLRLGGDVPDDMERLVEDQLQPNSAAGSGALEHDPCCLYRGGTGEDDDDDDSDRNDDDDNDVTAR